MADTGVTVIGAGVVGLAIAARLAPKNPDLVILDRNPRYGTETSSRNSEVIHAGFYYPTGSLKARLCVEGNRMLYDVCARHEVPHARLTKLVTAVTESELPVLDTLFALGRANGVRLERVSAAEAHRLEPSVASLGALFSPDTGIVSAHGLMDHYAHRARAAGAIFQMPAEVIRIERDGREYRVTTRTGEAIESFTSERVVNAAGLGADEVAAAAGIDVDAAGYRLHYCRGNYFSIAGGAARLSRLVYPVPSAESLGVHAVLDLTGRLKFGPDVEYLPDRRLEYRVDEARLPTFAAAVRRFLPWVREEDLTADMSGIRPKLQAKGQLVRDFVIAEESARGLPGLVSLVGIDSPGLTSAPAIAEHVAGLLGEA